MDTSIKEVETDRPSLMEFLGNLFRGGAVELHAVGGCGRAPRPGVLLAAAAVTMVTLAMAPHEAAAQAQGGITLSGDRAMVVDLNVPTQKLGTGTRATTAIGSAECRGAGNGSVAVTVIGNRVYCGNRTIGSGTRPDFVVRPGMDQEVAERRLDRLSERDQASFAARRHFR